MLILRTSVPQLGRKRLIRHVLSASRFQSTTPLQRYDQLVSENRLRDDSYQRGILTSLEGLHGELLAYKPPDVLQPDIKDLTPKTGLSKVFGSLFGKSHAKEPETVNVPHGIYLYGDVGCGKTMLMDLFYHTVPGHLTKRRVHFHQFMQNLHKRSHELKHQHGGHQELDVIPLLAWELAQQSTVLCFDEFQVTDVADAMLLRRLLNLVLRSDHGLILFATSNRAPDDLYINGIQRESFIPCIQLIKRVTNVIYLNSPTDYRKVPKPVSSVYYSPKPGIRFDSKISRKQQQQHIESWYEFFAQGHPKKENVPLKIWGRDLVVPVSSPGHVAMFTFDQLCGQPLAAGDYLTLASSYKAFIVTDIPYLSVNVRDKVRRFITFLDAVYDSHGCLAVTAAASFTDIFVEPEDIGNGDYSLLDHKDEQVNDALENDDLVKNHGFDKRIAKKAAMFGNLDEERFAFARALSRLSQMSTQNWIEDSFS
ncbi:hypothetical protein OGAPHI_001882 [Ogataea philodendri]|uniref:Protein AFG1 n=1 Tax=Ogataea philodendri TaxID=1378263 RepID=A0A9P8P9L5_9ASCO|nr:uncharacterized protein OGAPHI_001882 [Ogataea philodendri]KAH3668128.1 hypothetical protein OGAPHI_001882 [Ogataea philodendri]